MKKKDYLTNLFAQTLLLLLLTSQASCYISNYTLSTFLRGKVKERGLSCLIDVLEKVNHLGFSESSTDLAQKIREGVTQSIDITTLL